MMLFLLAASVIERPMLRTIEPYTVGSLGGAVMMLEGEMLDAHRATVTVGSTQCKVLADRCGNPA